MVYARASTRLHIETRRKTNYARVSKSAEGGHAIELRDNNRSFPRSGGVGLRCFWRQRLRQPGGQSLSRLQLGGIRRTAEFHLLRLHNRPHAILLGNVGERHGR